MARQHAWLVLVLALALTLRSPEAAGCGETTLDDEDRPVEIVPPHFSVSELRLHAEPQPQPQQAVEAQTTKKAKAGRKTRATAAPTTEYSPHAHTTLSHEYHGLVERAPPATPKDQCEFEISCNSAAHAKLPKFRTTLLHAPDGPEPPSSLRLPLQASAGPPGPPGVRGDKGERGSPGLAGDAVDSASDESLQRTAFFVGLMENFGPHSRPEDVRFDHIVTNVGNAYSQDSGRFTAPRNGTYQFHVTIAAQGDQRAAVRLLIKSPDSRDNRIVFTLWCESIPFWSSTSNSAVLWMNADEQVWVRALSTASAIHGYMYSTFSGHGLFPDDD